MKKSELIQSRLDRKTFELWTTLDSRHLAAFTELPTEIVGAARLALAGLKSAGQIDEFEIFEDRFAKVWDEMWIRKGSVHAVTFVIGAGYPKLQGVKISRALDEDTAAGYLTLSTPKTAISRWQPRWLFYYTNSQLKIEGTSLRANPAHIHCLWMHAALNGEPINRESFSPRPTLDQIPEGKDYIIRAYRTRQEVDIIFATFKSFRKDTGLPRLLDKVRRAVYKLATEPGGSGYYHLLNNHIKQTIIESRDGVQALGLELPVSILGALTLSATLLEGDVIKGIPAGTGVLFLAIMREMLTIEGAEFSREWFHKNFLMPVSEDSILDLMAVLKNRGFVDRDPETDTYRLSPNIVSAGYRICGRKVDPFHRTALSIAQGALATVSPARFIIQSHRFCLSEQMLGKLTELLHEFREKTVAEVRVAEARSQVYQVNLQFFPLTRLSPDYRRIMMEKHLQDAAPNEGADWYYYLVCELAKMENFRYDPKWVAGKLLLPLSINQAEKSLEHLKTFGYIAMDPIKNRFVTTAKTFDKIEDMPKDKVLLRQEKMLELASIALSEDMFERRNFSTMLLGIDESYVAKLQTDLLVLVAKMQEESLKSLGPDQLYQLNLQLFPHTKKAG